jgi:sarcosine oxidase subunit gamma
VTVQVLRDLAMIAITARRGREAALATALQRQVGLVPPLGPARLALGGAALIGLGPGRSLLVQAHPDPTRLAAGLALALEDQAAVVDLSESRLAFRLGGPKSRAVLARGLPVDLDPRIFGTGRAAASVVEHIPVLLWRLNDGHGFDVAVPRSLAASFAHWLRASAAPFGLDVLQPSVP